MAFHLVNLIFENPLVYLFSSSFIFLPSSLAHNTLSPPARSTSTPNYTTMANINDIAKAFVQHYYNMFQSNRASLAGLYVCPLVLLFSHA
jgi:hypothetical protein